MDPPIKPDESECCNSGCNPCILDVYETQLKKYNAQIGSEIPHKNAILELTYNKFKLVKIIPECTDVNFYIFEAIDEDNEGVFYETGQHFLLQGFSKLEQNYFTRAYTPIPYEGLKKGQFAVIIRLYDKGMMSEILKGMKIGSCSEWRGPYGEYHPPKTKYIFFIAQGTGIAPIYAILKKLLEDEDCESWITLYYCCRSLGQVMLRDEIYKMGDYWNFSAELFVTKRDDDKARYREIVHEQKLNEEAVKDFLKGKSDVHVGICGTNAFIDSFGEYVQNCKIDSTKIYKF